VHLIGFFVIRARATFLLRLNSVRDIRCGHNALVILIYSLPHISAFTSYRTAYLMSHSICGGKIVIDQGTCQRVSDAGVV
jgi:hypothetical protein